MTRRPTSPRDPDELLNAFAELTSRSVPPAAIPQRRGRPLVGALATGVAATVLVALVGGLAISRVLPQAAVPGTPSPPGAAIALPTSRLEAQGAYCYPAVLEGAFLAGSPADDRVAWVESERGQRVDVLWPTGFSVRFTPDVELHAPWGLMGRQGDELTIYGGFLPSGEFDACGGVAAGPQDIGGDPLPWPDVPLPSPTVPGEQSPSPLPLLTGEWRDIPEAPLVGRVYHSAVWTGTEMIVWGGWGGDRWSGNTPAYFADGAAYDPATHGWRQLADAPLTARQEHSALWTGTEMIVWGGQADGATALADGAAYDPAADAWRMLSPGPLGPRTGHSAVWTGAEMVVCGGGLSGSETSSPPCAAYDPAVDAWRELPPPPLPALPNTITWTGTELLTFVYPNDGDRAVLGAAYNPATNAWREVAESPMDGGWAGPVVWSGTEVLFLSHLTWSGSGLQTNAAYDPSADAWRALASPQGGGFSGLRPVWTGRDVLLHPGSVAYDPSSDSWRELMPPPGRRDAGEAFTAVWTGVDMLVWGGGDLDSHWARADGVAFRPEPRPPATTEPTLAPTPIGTVDVTATELTPPIQPTIGGSGVWTGAEVIVWGGQFDTDPATAFSARAFTAAGAAFDPASGTWRTLQRAPLDPRVGHVTAWTGSRMLIWGGTDHAVLFEDGAAYDPAGDNWRRLAPAPADWLADLRDSFNAGGELPEKIVSAWTGREWVVAFKAYGDDTSDWLRVAAYDPASDSWRELPTAEASRTEGVDLAWTGSELVVSSHEFMWRMTPDASAWRPVGSSPWDQAGHSPVWIGDRLAMVVPEWSGGGLRSAFLGAWDPAAGAWEALPPPPRMAWGTLVWDGRRLIPLGSGLAYDAVGEVWLEVPMLIDRERALTVWTGGQLLVWGGEDCAMCPGGIPEEVLLLEPEW
jgi:N-acetylneuraminic acid mutarotase